jgi:cell division protease FtsH
MNTDVDVEVLARMTPGMSGADIENLVNEAALIAARQDKSKVGMHDFESARDKVLMGNERRSMVMSERDLETTAYHEAGHALVGQLILDGDKEVDKRGDADPLHKVTIIPRGGALGLTAWLPDDRKTMSKSYAENRVAMAMGGRIAEEIIFGEYNTGAANDIDQATDIARRMVCEWGMSSRLGPLAFGRKEGEVFMGRDFQTTQQNYSEHTAQDIDDEVKRIVVEQYARAKKLIEANLEKLHAIAKALLEYETIDHKDIDVLMAGGSLTRTKPTVRIKTREQIEEDRKNKDTEARPTTAPPILGGPLPEPGGA